MASGSSARPSSASKGFDFGSDDILCDYSNDSSNGSTHSDPVIGSTSASKDFQKSRMARSAIFPAPVYNQQEDSFEQDVIFTVEKSMKKHTDNLMRFLEGISSRLSQLELYCYNLDKSIGEMRSDLTRDHGEADSKLKSLEKHVQEVHRSVQILRDKQELADTQKELAKLHLVQKESSSSSHSQTNEERASLPASDPKRNDASETQNQQLALALPQQIAPQPQPQQQTMAPPPQAPAPNVNQQQSYYLPPTHFTTPQVQSQAPQNQYLPPDPQYRTSQLQDPTRVAPQQTQSQVNQTPASQPFQVNQTPVSHPFPQYQQQWSQQLPQQAPPPQQPSMQPQVRPPAPYPSYQPSQPSNPSPPETLPNSMPMQPPFSGISQSGPSRAADTVPYGYGGPGRTAQQQPPPQQLKGTYGAQPGDGYAASVGPHPALPPGNGYMMYESEGGRTHHTHQPHFQQSGYPPSQPNSGNMVRNSPSQPQYVRNHPYNELIEKLVNMGFRGDHVMNVIQRMEESGQPVDFNAVLDRLNVQSSGGPQRGW